VSPLTASWQRLLLGWGWNNFFLDLLVMCGLMGPAALALLAWRVYQSALSLTDSFVEAGLLLLFAYASLVPSA